MCRRVLASASSFAILCGAIMLASRADAITLAVPSGLRAAAATTDLSQQVQYYCGSAWGYGGYGDGGYSYSSYGDSGYGYGGYPAYGYGYGGPYYGYGGYSRSYYGYGGYPGWGHRVRWW
jgi:hypothetical protein